MKRVLFAVMLVGWAAPALAHDFWLQPLNFNPLPGASIPFTILVGHGPFRTRWSGATDRVTLLSSYGPDGKTDHKRDLHPSSDKDGDIGFRSPGTYVLAFESTHAESTLPSIRFNDYISVEGLTPAIEARAAAKATERPGREIYSRRAKAIVNVGSAPAGKVEPWVTKPVGLTLEIVPEKNPYALAAKEPLPVRIYYEGKPLPGALVKLTNLEFDLRPVATKRSDGEGRASFDLPRTGTWLVNVIWTKPLKGDPRADFDTTFSSLTFGYGRAVGH